MRISSKRALGLAACVVAAVGLLLRGSAGDEETDRLKRLAADVARDLATIREKPLEKLPPVERISKKAFIEQYAIANFRFMWGDRYEDAMSVFKALGLIPKKVDAEAFIRQYGSMMVAAAYDILEGRVLFPDTAVRRDILLHELTHALTDRHFDIKKLMRATGGNLDRILAMGALIEGEATLVQLHYNLGDKRIAFSLAPYEQMRRFARAYAEDLLKRWQKALPDIPENVIRTQAFVYDEGILFVEKLRRLKRGWDAVDLAYGNPPRSTTQIMHPEKYLAGEWPIEIDMKDKETRLPGSRLIAENTLGEFGTGLFLRSHEPKVKETEAPTAEGWRGDRVFLYRDKDGDETLVWVSSWETSKRADEMFKALLERMRVFADSYPPFTAKGTAGPGVFGRRVDRTIQISVGANRERFDNLLKDGLITKEPERKPPFD